MDAVITATANPNGRQRDQRNTAIEATVMANGGDANFVKRINKSIPIVSNFVGILLTQAQGSSNEIGVDGNPNYFIVRVTQSNKLTVPVGTRLYLHSDLYVVGQRVTYGDSVYFNAAANPPQDDPMGGPKIRVAYQVKGYK